MDAGESTTAVAVTRLTKRFPGVIALNEVSFDVRMGEVHAVVGENGAGKSTLIKAITGVEQPDAGHIEIFGRLVDGQNATARRAEGVTAIYQELTIAPAMSATANVFLRPSVAQGVLPQAAADAARLPQSKLPPWCQNRSRPTRWNAFDL